MITADAPFSKWFDIWFVEVYTWHFIFIIWEIILVTLIKYQHIYNGKLICFSQLNCFSAFVYLPSRWIVGNKCVTEHRYKSISLEQHWYGTVSACNSVFPDLIQCLTHKVITLIINAFMSSSIYSLDLWFILCWPKWLTLFKHSAESIGKAWLSFVIQRPSSHEWGGHYDDETIKIILSLK